jgi:sugar/nucleoside kinase (ribokinase family)
MNTLLTIGSVAFDKIETPLGKTEKIMGGAGTYISLAASNFNIINNIVSVVGYDFTDDLINILKAHKINTEGIERKKNEKTFFWHGRYSQEMNDRDTLATELNCLADFTPKIPDNFKNPDILLLGNLMPTVQRQAIEQLEKRPQLIVMDTMNFWMDTMWDELLKTISMVDILAVNDSEVRQLSGIFNIPEAAIKVLELGPKYVIVKKGEHGAMLFSKEDIFIAPAFPLNTVFDPTGAGDSFAGGFCGYLAQTNDLSFENLKNAMMVGTAIASFTVEKFGTEKLQNLPKSG